MVSTAPGAGSPDSQVGVFAFLEGGDAFEAREPPRRIDTH
jgi:hypothetical protein